MVRIGAEQLDEDEMRARIFKRSRPATQSGTAGTQNWVLDWQTPEREVNDPLMGWWGSGNTQGQVRLRFDSCEEAVAYAKGNGIDYEIELPPSKSPLKPKSYAENFRYGRPENWTH